LDRVLHYFPTLTPHQKDGFAALYDVYAFWNDKINVISRKDLPNFYERHILHSLAIAKVHAFSPGKTVLDVGTGGGFPGIPLAILFPESPFLLVDSIGKKIQVVREVCEALELKNVRFQKGRAEETKGSFDFIVSRAVTAMPIFLSWVNQKITPGFDEGFQHGVLYLKGGDLTEELRGISGKVKTFSIQEFYEEPFFETKKVVHWFK
jgi:16S rRNA (guanine527-N7)-methyltransferase